MVRDKRGRFVKGQSGNPKGRLPRATEDQYRGVINDTITLDRFATMLEKQIQRAERGDLAAFNTLAKLLGLDVQKIDQHNDGELKITVVYERVDHKTSNPA